MNKIHYEYIDSIMVDSVTLKYNYKESLPDIESRLCNYRTKPYKEVFLFDNASICKHFYTAGDRKYNKECGFVLIFKMLAHANTLDELRESIHLLIMKLDNLGFMAWKLEFISTGYTLLDRVVF